jgi:hypothetical protein
VPGRLSAKTAEDITGDDDSGTEALNCGVIGSITPVPEPCSALLSA